MLAYVERKGQIEHSKLRALAQVVIDPKAGIDVFKEYMDIAFPWLEKKKANQNKTAIELMMAAIKGGPLAVKEMQQVQVRSRLKQKVERPPALPPTTETSRRISERLGSSIPLRGGRRA